LKKKINNGNLEDS